MREDCLNYRLTDKERRQFDEEGFLIVRDVMTADQLARFEALADRIDAEDRISQGIDQHALCSVRDFIGRDAAFLELLEHPKTFAKVFEILGWNIQLYHSHLNVTPPVPPELRPEKTRMRWHQDSDRVNRELEGDPKPRVSLKVAYFLTDTTEIGRANFYVIPGSHLLNKITFPDDPKADPPDALPIQVKAGDAVFFDRRLWHTASPNSTDAPRKVLFYGYSYRWLRPRDNMTVEQYYDQVDAITRQILGHSPTGGYGYSSPTPEDVPLREWIRQHCGEDAVAR
ncbi:MAG: phytanoyl-CoA dioxygenase family protein [Candidatus Poribacteria bacterium]|nr:phytanoyl-CoA dioxygenase family protein [Candidatus Poribacteria bacterium]